MAARISRAHHGQSRIPINPYNVPCLSISFRPRRTRKPKRKKPKQVIDHNISMTTTSTNRTVMASGNSSFCVSNVYDSFKSCNTGNSSNPYVRGRGSNRKLEGGQNDQLRTSAASAFLSKWMEQNSFRITESVPILNSDDDDDDDDDDSISDCSSSGSAVSNVSSVSIDDELLDHNVACADLGLSDLGLSDLGLSSLGCNNLDDVQEEDEEEDGVYENDDDPFRRSLRSSRSKSFHDAPSISDSSSSSLEDHNSPLAYRRSSSVGDGKPLPHNHPSRRTNFLTWISRRAPTITQSPSGIQLISQLPYMHPITSIKGKYTGQINDQMKPHGCGVLIFGNGSAETCIWKEGVPFKDWKPKDRSGGKVVTKGENKESKPVKKKKSLLRPWPSQSQPQLQQPVETLQPTVEPPSSSQQWPIIKQVSFTSDNSISTDHPTYLPHLKLGDNGTPQDMILPSSSSSSSSTKQALKRIASLKVHDFTFIKRSGGRWTYAIIANRSKRRIRFVVDDQGSTKTLSKKHWMSGVRLVNPEEACFPGVVDATKKKKKKSGNSNDKKSSNKETCRSKHRRSKSKEDEEACDKKQDVGTQTSFESREKVRHLKKKQRSTYAC